ncbi:uncharacterized protein DDB_G0290685-like isoform X2 [Schistocerca nitens]|uniref:uncharacterized protein DDB_G0290685-like isoform X2 n=1 Tax=Schistocerca nitens TaxID=7011 RepID=UPI002117623B|nr:uncharacterized protein DDB_G0290685-like isoform X2 [Schistocerca nitens]
MVPMSQRRICYWPGQTDWARDWLFLDLDDSDSDSDDELNAARLGATTSCYDPSAAPDACCCSYNRPWRHTPAVKSGFSKIERSKDGFKVTLDVQHFKEGDLKVKVVGNQVVVEAEHDERQDEHGLISRSLRRKYALPEDVDIEKVASELSSDGILTITAPKKETDRLARGSERLIPIIKVNKPALTSKMKGDKEATPGTSRSDVVSGSDAGDADDEGGNDDGSGGNDDGNGGNDDVSGGNDDGNGGNDDGNGGNDVSGGNDDGNGGNDYGNGGNDDVSGGNDDGDGGNDDGDGGKASCACGNDDGNGGNVDGNDGNVDGNDGNDDGNDGNDDGNDGNYDVSGGNYDVSGGNDDGNGGNDDGNGGNDDGDGGNVDDNGGDGGDLG